MKDVDPKALLDPGQAVPAFRDDNAADSRTFGPVPGRDVCAVALKIVYAKDMTRVGRQP